MFQFGNGETGEAIRGVKGEFLLVLGGAGEYQIHPLTPNFRHLHAMSQHKSLQGSSGLVVKRNVLKRFERIDLLKKRGYWKPGDRVQGLRKTKPDV